MGKRKRLSEETRNKLDKWIERQEVVINEKAIGNKRKVYVANSFFDYTVTWIKNSIFIKIIMHS